MVTVQHDLFSVLIHLAWDCALVRVVLPLQLPLGRLCMTVNIVGASDARLYLECRLLGGEGSRTLQKHVSRGGLGSCPPRTFLDFWSFQIDSDAICNWQTIWGEAPPTVDGTLNALTVVGVLNLQPIASCFDR